MRAGAKPSCLSSTLRYFKVPVGSGATVAARHADAVDGTVFDAVETGDRALDFGAGDILALPAEGIADAVDELDVAQTLITHEVAGVEVAVTFLEYVTDQ